MRNWLSFILIVSIDVYPPGIYVNKSMDNHIRSGKRKIIYTDPPPPYCHRQ